MSKDRKAKPLKTDVRMIINFVSRDGKVIKDHKARLIEISPYYFIVETAYDVPEDTLLRAEGIFSAGRLMQPFPLAGDFVSKQKRVQGIFQYVFYFGGMSYYAMKYIHIKSPRKGAGRPKKIRTEVTPDADTEK